MRARSDSVAVRCNQDMPQYTAGGGPSPGHLCASQQTGDVTVEARIVAGGHMADRGMPPTAQSMREAGPGAVRFNYRHTARKSGRLGDLFLDGSDRI